ncbi:dipeptidase PepV [Polycladomyces abyssicola]|uniref:Dipeptidase PepV n=1 Tax=Polycladomyces abyssicola TaxID=1125966 RepID=A0A8D5UGB7_9BACL|nr:dipeptidase PepV [Polycladomyces abyssicola]BCU82872.1 dipeptidase PepV [Polycladomyces abyssicola]
MTIDWQKEVESRKDELLEKLNAFLSIESVLDPDTAGEGAPFGKGIHQALTYMLELGKENGFTVKNLDGYAGHIEYGEGEEIIGVLSHVDVVPAGDGWTTPPFSPDIRDGKLYARGAIDDKGPTMAAFFALKIVKELGLPLSKKVRLILGTDEETYWRCMDHYFKHEPMPVMGFTPDADFPLIVAEKGFLDISLRGEVPSGEPAADGEDTWTLASFTAGQRVNMVPDLAKAKLVGEGDVFGLKEQYQEFLLSRRIRGYAEEADDHLMLVLEGVSHHGSEPDKGLNAALELIRFLKEKVQLDADGQRYVDFAHRYLVDSFFGEKMGLAQSDDIVGKLTVNAGVFHYERELSHLVRINVRYPISGDHEAILRKIDELARPYGLRVEDVDHKAAHAVDKNHELVRTLSRVYEEQTGQKAELLAIGGGTYARALDVGVAFGPLFPGREETAHQKDEHIVVDNLLKATAIYAQAIYELAK